MGFTDSIPQYGPLLMAGGDRTIYRARLHGVSALSTSDSTFISPTVSGDMYLLDVDGSRRIHYYDAQISGFVPVPRLNYDESVTGQWSFSPGSARAPFVLGSNAYDQKVLRLNADLVDGAHADASPTASTIPIRDASGRMKAADPSADDDVATKSWTESVAVGFRGRGEARIVITANFACTRSGNILTATSNGSINSSGITDGVTTLALNDEVLLVGQSAGEQNGKYFVSQVGDGSNPAKFTRTTNLDADAEMVNGVSVLINEGTAGAGSTWALSTTGTITLNTTVLVWVAFNRPAVYLAGNGMVKSGLTFHAITASAYTTGGFIYAASTSTLGITSALSGLIYGAGSSGPAAVTTLTANALPRAKGSAPYLQDSCLIDDGTVLTTSRAFKPTATTTYDLGASGACWKDIYASSLVSVAGTGSSVVPHVAMQATVSSTLGYKWSLGLVGATSSANAGANFSLDRYDDSGGWISAAMTILRASGNVGIGTSSPDYLLHVKGALGIIVAERTGVNGVGPAIVGEYRSDAKTSGDAVIVSMSGLDSGSASQIYAQFRAGIVTATSGSEDGDYQIWTVNSGTLAKRWTVKASGVLESLGAQTIQTSTGNLSVLTAAGNGNINVVPHGSGMVGIGTSSPGRFLDVAGNCRAFRSGPSFMEFKRADLSGTNVSAVGMLGTREANLAYNMDYTTGVHEYYDSSYPAMWLALHGSAFAVQYTAAGLGSDIWTSGGSRYLIYGNSNGQVMINTNMADITGLTWSGTLTLPRSGGSASVCGISDFVIEGAMTTGTSGPVYVNAYNSGHIYLANGGGSVLVNTVTAHSRLSVVTNSLGVTQTNTSGLAMVNQTAAASGAQQISPALRFRGYGWKTATTAASQSVDARLHLVPVEGASAPTGYVSLQWSINGGSYVETLRLNSSPLAANSSLYVDSNGQLSSVSVVSGSTQFLTQGSSGAPAFFDLFATANSWTANNTFSSAKITLKAGVSGSGGSPLKFTSGVNLTSAEEGAMEYDGAQLSFTRASGANRFAVALAKSFNVGDGTSLAYTITHNMGTQSLVPILIRASDNQVVGGPKIVASTTDAVVVTFTSAPSSNQFRLVLISCGA